MLSLHQKAPDTYLLKGKHFMFALPHPTRYNDDSNFITTVYIAVKDCIDEMASDQAFELILAFRHLHIHASST